METEAWWQDPPKRQFYLLLDGMQQPTSDGCGRNNLQSVKYIQMIMRRSSSTDIPNYIDIFFKAFKSHVNNMSNVVRCLCEYQKDERFISVCVNSIASNTADQYEIASYQITLTSILTHISLQQSKTYKYEIKLLQYVREFLRKLSENPYDLNFSFLALIFAKLLYKHNLGYEQFVTYLYLLQKLQDCPFIPCYYSGAVCLIIDKNKRTKLNVRFLIDDFFETCSGYFPYVVNVIKAIARVMNKPDDRLITLCINILACEQLLEDETQDLIDIFFEQFAKGTSVQKIYWYELYQQAMSGRSKQSVFKQLTAQMKKEYRLSLRSDIPSDDDLISQIIYDYDHKKMHGITRRLLIERLEYIMRKSDHDGLIRQIGLILKKMKYPYCVIVRAIVKILITREHMDDTIDDMFVYAIRANRTNRLMEINNVDVFDMIMQHGSYDDKIRRGTIWIEHTRGYAFNGMGKITNMIVREICGQEN